MLEVKTKSCFLRHILCSYIPPSSLTHFVSLFLLLIRYKSFLLLWLELLTSSLVSCKLKVLTLRHFLFLRIDLKTFLLANFIRLAKKESTFQRSLKKWIVIGTSRSRCIRPGAMKHFSNRRLTTRVVWCRRSSVDVSAPSILPPRVRIPSTPSTLLLI